MCESEDAASIMPKRVMDKVLQNEDLIITRVANGYIARPRYGSSSETKVCLLLNDLTKIVIEFYEDKPSPQV